HQHVRAGDHVRVELPGVVTEAAGAVEILADVDAATAQAALSHEGVGGADVGRSDLVRELARLLRRPEAAGRSPEAHAAHLWTRQRSAWASAAAASPRKPQRLGQAYMTAGGACLAFHQAAAASAWPITLNV